MPKFQQRPTKNTDVSGNPHQYWTYPLTIPYRIVKKLHVKSGDKFYAVLVQNRIILKESSTIGSIPVTVQLRNTRKYQGEQYYTTEILIPTQFVKTLELKKGESIDVDTKNNAIVIRTLRRPS